MNTKRTLRAWILLLLAGGLFLVGCNEAPMPPSDTEMILHFTQHASAFEDIRAIIDHCHYGRYYRIQHACKECQSRIDGDWILCSQRSVASGFFM